MKPRTIFLALALARARVLKHVSRRLRARLLDILDRGSLRSLRRGETTRKGEKKKEGGRSPHRARRTESSTRAHSCLVRRNLSRPRIHSRERACSFTIRGNRAEERTKKGRDAPAPSSRASDKIRRVSRERNLKIRRPSALPVSATLHLLPRVNGISISFIGEIRNRGKEEGKGKYTRRAHDISSL